MNIPHDQLYVLGTAAVIVLYLIGCVLSGKFDPFAPVWLFMVGFIQIYVIQAISYRGSVPHLIEERLYRPAARISLGLAVHARRLQSGRLGTYVAYLIALVLLLLLAARVGVIG